MIPIKICIRIAYDCASSPSGLRNSTQTAQNRLASVYIFRLQLLPLVIRAFKERKLFSQETSLPLWRCTTHRVTLAVGVGVIAMRRSLWPRLVNIAYITRSRRGLPVWSTVPQVHCTMSTQPTPRTVHCPMSLATWLSASGACGWHFCASTRPLIRSCISSSGKLCTDDLTLCERERERERVSAGGHIPICRTTNLLATIFELDQSSRPRRYRLHVAPSTGKFINI